jgi:hypothetical protein
MFIMYSQLVVCWLVIDPLVEHGVDVGTELGHLLIIELIGRHPVLDH